MLNPVLKDEYLDMSDDEETDSGSSESSDDDEISILMKSSDSLTTQKKIFRKDSKKQKEENLASEFDKEMESELCEKVSALESMRKLLCAAGAGHLNQNKQEARDDDEAGATTKAIKGPDDCIPSVKCPKASSSIEKGEKNTEKLYDDIYFDSDEETEKDSVNSKHKILSNDELLYDPEMDKLDQLWMDNKRRKPHIFSVPKRQKEGKKVKNTSDKNIENDCQNSLTNSMKRKNQQQRASKSRRRQPQSDAVLDCPACMTTLCIDCQKHECFPNQYRAMFVMNCSIDFTEIFRYPHENPGKKRKRQQVQFIADNDDNKNSTKDNSTMMSSSSDEKDDVYYSVKCDECSTKVAMYDKEEVYHFFNVISSYG